MTLHVTYNHNCEFCQAEYIPYDEDVPCPKCGRVEVERFDFVPWAAASLLANKKETGHYYPRGWAVMSLGDQVLSAFFGLFEGYAQSSQGKSFAEYASSQFSATQWGDRPYLQNHLQGIALRVKEVLEGVEKGQSLPPLVPAKRVYDFHCPDCRTGLERTQQTECSSCGWLKYPAVNREKWNQVGSCPKCGFSYRWDGNRCSHCGLKA